MNSKNIETCYKFICCKPSNSLDEIREKFVYYLYYVYDYNYAVYNYLKINKEKNNCKTLKKIKNNEIKKIDIFNYFIYQSYLCILYHKLIEIDKFEQRIECFINSINVYKLNNPSPLIKIINYDKENYVISKSMYIDCLNNILNNESNATNAKLLKQIIDIEKQLLKKDKDIKCLSKRNKAKYGELNFFDK